MYAPFRHNGNEDEWLTIINPPEDDSNRIKTTTNDLQRRKYNFIIHPEASAPRG